MINNCSFMLLTYIQKILDNLFQLFKDNINYIKYANNYKNYTNDNSSTEDLTFSFC